MLREGAMTRHLLAAAALAGLALPGLAAAQTIPGEQLTAVDANSDAQVSLEEWTSIMNQAFGALDVNGDGFIEWSEAEVTMNADHFRGADEDGNNAIDENEFMAQVAEDFAAADKDGDGVLD
jgi:Ca2+-binding EF-hand superfamily protein